MKQKNNLFIGTSGWSYKHWYERFYPKNLKSYELLPYYTKFFTTTEVNTTFYHLPKDKMVKNWYKRTPTNFLFSLKVSRTITHYKKLKDVKESLEIFFKSIIYLKRKIGILLHQLPPSLKKDEELLKKYLRSLPKKYKHCIEFRHNSWFCDNVFELLKKYKVCLCVVNHPKIKEVYEITSSFVYIRMHGKKSLYKSLYSNKQLKDLAKKIKEFLKKDLLVFVYFNNDQFGFAVKNALTLKKMLKDKTC
jgi:uncharacterized protein YecE (DUF72 family)